MAALERRDLIVCERTTGILTVAYPFSGRPTRHMVVTMGVQAVYAMCAVDALGIPFLPGRDAQIASTDLITGEPVLVDVRVGAATWFPPAAVVSYSRSTAPGPLGWVCRHKNFFRASESAAAYLRDHPEVPGQILPLADAVAIGRQRFGGLLRLPGFARDVDEARECCKPRHGLPDTCLQSRMAGKRAAVMAQR